jgi:hypothetical protein
MPALAPPPEADNTGSLDLEIRTELAKMVRRQSRAAGAVRARISLICDVRVSPEGALYFERLVTSRVL